MQEQNDRCPAVFLQVARRRRIVHVDVVYGRFVRGDEMCKIQDLDINTLTRSFGIEMLSNEGNKGDIFRLFLW